MQSPHLGKRATGKIRPIIHRVPMGVPDGQGEAGRKQNSPNQAHFKSVSERL
jgi:hypothetical protein